MGNGLDHDAQSPKPPAERRGVNPLAGFVRGRHGGFGVAEAGFAEWIRLAKSMQMSARAVRNGLGHDAQSPKRPPSAVGCTRWQVSCEDITEGFGVAEAGCRLDPA